MKTLVDRMYGIGFDDGGLAAIRFIEKYRREHPIKWFLTGGRPYLHLLRDSIESQMRGRSDNA